MVKSIPKYAKAFIIGLQSSMEYRTDFLLSIFSGSITIIVQCFLWTAIFKSTGSHRIYGYTYVQLIAYSVLAGLVSKFVSTGFEGEISNDIKTGGLSRFLVQPISYFIYRICCFLGAKVFQLFIAFSISLGVILFLNTYMGLNVSLSSMLISLIPIFFSICLNFLIFFCLSTLSFWMTEVWAVFLGANVISSILNGGVFPLDIFGEKVVRISNMLPFKYVVYFPVNVLNGKLVSGDIVIGILMQVFWMFISGTLCVIFWRLGVKKYAAVGG